MKKNRKFKISFAFLLAISMFFGCTEDFDKLNTRKDLVTDDVVDINLILTRTQTYAFVRDLNGHRCGEFCGLSTSESGGLFNIEAYNNMWTANYTNYARNLSRIIDLTSDNEDLINKNAIARIMKVWAFSQSTDLYGDIPYSESALPLDQVIYTPKYDTQKSMYEDFFVELKDAASKLNASKESYGSADVLYGGDVEKWKKFANSLRLRLAMRVRYVDSQMATAQMSDLGDADLITSSADNAYLMTSTDYTANTNPSYNDLEAAGENYYNKLAPKTMIDLWQDNNDPRLAFYADTAKSTVQSFGYRGRPVLGDAPLEQKYAYAFESVSRFSLYLAAAVVPIPVITAAEVNFTLAEAALFGLKGSEADAQNFYKRGIEAAMDWSLLYYNTTAPQINKVLGLFNGNVTGDEIAAYDAFHALTQSKIDNFINTAPVVNLTGSKEEKLEMIINQKMLSYFPRMVIEGFADWRRTGYPRVLVGDDSGDLKGVAPRRYLYPKYEQTLNAESYNEVVQRIGSDHMHTKVWWDANPNAPHEHSGVVEWRDTPYGQ